MKPGSAQRNVTNPCPRSRSWAFWTPSARSCSASTSCSSASMSCRSRRGTGSGPSGGEELDILLLPGDENRLALSAPEVWIALAGDLRQHPLAARHEVKLHEIAEELDEDDLAAGGVAGIRVAGLADLDGRGPDRDERLVADGRDRPHAGEDADLNVVLVL